jgi:NADH:ubiquinone oxidoreductase subunit F (NADH-binding)
VTADSGQWGVLPDRPIRSLDAYVDSGGRRALENARHAAPENVIEELTRPGLRGRAVAGFPTGTKRRICFR